MVVEMNGALRPRMSFSWSQFASFLLDVMKFWNQIKAARFYEFLNKHQVFNKHQKIA